MTVTRKWWKLSLKVHQDHLARRATGSLPLCPLCPLRARGNSPGWLRVLPGRPSSRPRGRAWIEARKAARAAAEERKAAPGLKALRAKTRVWPSSSAHRLSLADLRAAAAVASHKVGRVAYAQRPTAEGRHHARRDRVRRRPRADGQPRVTLRIGLPDRTVTAEIAAKSLRKAQIAIREAGPDNNIALVLQSRLIAGNALAEAGLAAQPKAAKTKPP